MNRVSMWSFHVLLGLFVLGGINSPPWNTEAYNIESRHYTVYRGERGSMFGFSVAEYRDKKKRGRVLVGAPRAQTNVPNVYQGGAVYICDVAHDDQCKQLSFDNQEHTQVKDPTEPHMVQIDNKTMQWFGATVATSSQDGGPILACAPRYVFFGAAEGYNLMSHREERAFGNQRDPVGSCYLMDMSTRETRNFAPCRTQRYGYHLQGSCQAGFGAAISKNGERMFVGAPGSWYWQGQIYSIPNDSEEYPFMPPLFGEYGDFAGQIFTQQTDNRNKVMFTKQAAETEDDRYLGYAVISGDFIGNNEPGTAVGAPRGNDLHGMVRLLSWNMTEIQTITGPQMGCYFGYALAAGDIDNDGLDDLIVGAPMYTVKDNPQMHFETGQVYIYYGKGPNKYTVFEERSGETNRGRFGMSLAYLGDIDHDGYGDFAVGAPYAGPQGRGAVYIYQGSAEGLLEKYTQVIYGEELSSSVETFGFSVAGGLDLDGNFYPDMIVGSYESDTAMFFRSRPVIKMVPYDTYVQFGSSDKLISLDDRDCRLTDGTQVTCLELKTCFKYTGDGVLPRYNFNVQYALDTKTTLRPRMYFLDHEGKSTMNVSIGANRNEQYCRNVKVYIESKIRDKLTSLDAEMRMNLEDNLRFDNRSRNPLLVLRPILARTSLKKDSVSIRKNCGSDNICTPDLQLNCTSPVTEYLMGSDDRIVLKVIVVNAYEDAFEAMVNLKIPPGIDYIKIERIDKAEIPVQCSPVKQGQNFTLKCDIGNPLPKDNLVHFNIILQPMAVHDEMSSYRFETEATSANPEIFSTTHDNKKNVSIKIWVKTDLRIDGESKPKEVYYNPANYTSTNVTTELEYGPAFAHNYTIHNGGPFTVEEAEIFLVWPAATLAGDDLVYLIEQPETSGPIKCASANSNPLSLKLEQRHHHISATEGKITGHGTGGGTSRYPPIPTHNGSETKIHGGGAGGSIGQGTAVSGGHFSTEVSSNSSREVTYGPNGEVIVVEEEWKQKNGIVTRKNVTTTKQFFKSASRHDGQEIRRQNEQSNEETRHQEKLANERRLEEEENEEIRRRVEEEERRRQQQYEEDLRRQHNQREELRRVQEMEDLRRRQEDEARRRQEDEARRRQEEQDNERRRLEEQRSREIVYGTEKHYGSGGEALSHRVVGGGSVLSTGLRTDQVISGDREINIKGSDFGLRLSNVTSSQDLSSFLSTLTRDSVGYDVFTEGGKQYLRFLGRFRVSNDGKEYVEFKDHTTFPLENRYGGPSVAADGARTAVDRRFNALEGQIVTSGDDGKAYIQLRDGRRFALKGSYSYTEEHTYTTAGGGRQGHSFSSTSEHRSVADDEEDAEYDENYDSSWQEESSSRGKDSQREFESHSTRTHEERRTSQRQHGSRVYGHSEAPLGDDPSAYHPDSGFHKRGSRHRREGDALTVEEFRKYEKSHRLHKRNAEPEYDDFGNRDDLSNLNDGRVDEKSVLPLCTAAKCVSLRCTLGRLEKNQEVWITARYRVNAATLKKIAAREDLRVSTQLVAQVTKLPSVGKPEKDVVKSKEIPTTLQPQEPPPVPDVVPLWIVVLSACAGVIILLLLIYILHKCGFFKRNRPTDAPERQPLNRNGHFHGDDHL